MPELPPVLVVLLTAALIVLPTSLGLWVRRPLVVCRLGLHRWNYSGNAHTHAPRPIRCERCGTRYR